MTHPPVSRERVVRTLTFWLRPEFVLRVVSRFQKVAGFDRSIALASSALTATIPLTIVASSLSSQLGGRETAERVIDRYELTGGGAEAVTDVFSPPSGTSTSIGILGALFVLIAVLSFTRAVQRLFELTWELEPLSVRNTVNGLVWIGGLSVWIFVSGAIHAALGVGRLELVATLVIVPLSVVFLVWSGRMLSAKRLSRDDLLPFAVIGSGLFAAYSVGATVYVPAPLQHVRHALRRDRRGPGHDLRVLLDDGRPGGLGRGRARGPRRARPHPPRRAARGERGPAAVGRGQGGGAVAAGDAALAPARAPWGLTGATPARHRYGTGWQEKTGGFCGLKPGRSS